MSHRTLLLSLFAAAISLLFTNPALAQSQVHGNVRVGGSSSFSLDEGYSVVGLPNGLHGLHASVEFEVLPRLTVGAGFRYGGARGSAWHGDVLGEMNSRLSAETVDVGLRYFFMDRSWFAPFVHVSGAATFGQLVLAWSNYEPDDCNTSNSEICALSQRRGTAIVPFAQIGGGAEFLLPRKPRGTQGSESSFGLRVEFGTSLGGGRFFRSGFVLCLP